MRQLYTYVADESTLRLVEDGMSTGLTNKKKAREYSVLYHVFARKQCYLCSALRHKSYLTLPLCCIDRLEIHSALELSLTALLSCRLAASRRREAACWLKYGYYGGSDSFVIIYQP